MEDGILYTSIINAAKDEEEKPEESEEESSARPRLILIASIIIALGIVLTAINYLQPSQPTSAVIIDLTNETTTSSTTTTVPVAEETTTTTLPSEGFTVILKKGDETWSKFIAITDKIIDAEIDLSNAVLVAPEPTETSMFVEVPFTWKTSGTLVTEKAETEPTELKVSSVDMVLNHMNEPGILKEVGNLLSYSTGRYSVEVLLNGQKVASCTLKGTGGPYTDSCSMDVSYDSNDDVVIRISSDEGIWLTSTDFGFVSSNTEGGRDPFVTIKYMKNMKTTLSFESDAEILYLFYK